MGNLLETIDGNPKKYTLSKKKVNLFLF